MPKPRKSSWRRKYFLLDSNQTKRQRPKRNRNRVLNMLSRLRFLRQIGRFVRGSAILFILCLCMAGFVIFAVFSPYFELKKINILRDNPYIDAVKVDQSLQDFYGKNLLFLDKKGIEDQLLTTFPEFRTVLVQEQWPDQIEIKVELSPPAFTLLNEFDASFSVMSADGVVLRQNADDTLPLIKVLDYQKSLPTGIRFITSEYIQKINLAREQLVQIFEFEIEEIRLLPIAQELHIVNSQGVVFWIDLQLSVESQIQKMQFAEDEIGLHSGQIEYVDLRIPDRIYWKPKP